MDACRYWLLMVLLIPNISGIFGTCLFNILNNPGYIWGTEYIQNNTCFQFNYTHMHIPK